MGATDRRQGVPAERGDDFLLHVGVPDLDALHAFLLDRLGKRREVTGFRTSVIFQQVSNPVPSRLRS